MKITVIGTGHMGGWLAGKFSENHHVAVFDTDPEKLAPFLEIPDVKILAGLEQIAGFAPEMLINGVSLQHTVEVFRQVEPYLPAECMLVDLASIKGEIPDYYRDCPFSYVSVHPMFGPTFGDMELFKNENAVIITESDPEGKKFFREFFDRLGLRIFEYSAREHDDMMAYSLTLPFVSSMVFAGCMDNTAVPGSTFAKHLKIARGLMSEDDRLLTEILFSVNSLPQLAKVTSRLEFLKHVIMGRDYEEARRFFKGLRENIGG